MKTTQKLSLFAFLLLLLAGCASAPGPVTLYEFGATDSSRAAEAWMDGNEPVVDGRRSPEESFLRGEMLYWQGDLEGALEQYLLHLRSFAGHPLNRYAVMRVYGLRFDVVDFSERVFDALSDLRLDEEETLTRYALVRLSHFVARDRWFLSDDDEPFAFAHGGAFSLWRASPRMSPWRLVDFDREFEPEKSERLSLRYRSPQIATGDPQNWQPSRVVALNRPNDRLHLGNAGIYYLEGYLNVEGTRARKYTLGAQFPGAAKVWIGGEKVFERREEGYEPGRMFREVELGPGSHRVLVKLAHQPGVRDWFELFVVPGSGALFGNAGLRTSLEAERDAGTVRLSGEVYPSMALEPVQLSDDKVARVDGATLYAAALSAYASGESEAFDQAWEALMDRHPEFVGGYLLAAQQVRTRWDMPSELRDATVMGALRTAQQLDPDNLTVLVELERWLRDGNPREHRELLERARQMSQPEGGLTQIRPLVNWARHLEQKNWTEEAEEAWRHVLRVDPANCLAAGQLQTLYRQRNFMPAPEEITPAVAGCIAVTERWLDAHPERLEAKHAFLARQAKRFPFDAALQRDLAEAKRAIGDVSGAQSVLDEAIRRLPQVSSLWEARAELALLNGDEDEAGQIMDRAMEFNGRTAALDFRRTQLAGLLPLQELMPDGYRAAMEEVRQIGQAEEIETELEIDSAQAMALDDAYYVVDFRGVKYFDDGSSWTLTHRVVRVMTRGAIDRYAEISVPANARLLQARTIKQNGQTRVPDDIPGKDTLSMPGLAEGDMVELAYLQFHRPREVASHAEGLRFFFQMPSISSRHSEFVVVNSRDLVFETANGAPEPEYFELEGQEAVRFLATDVRHPRSEPRLVSSLEYLPWAREYRIGIDMHVLDAERRYTTESLKNSARMAPAVRSAIGEWLGRTPEAGQGASDEEVKRMFYEVAALFSNPTTSAFGTAATHAVQLRRGNPLVVLHTALNYLGVDNDVYLARSDERPPMPVATGEINRFDSSLMRVKMPDTGEVVWLQMDRTDAMFGAIEPELDGQAAICISCEAFKEETVKNASDRAPRRHIELVAELSKDGTLTGAMNYRFEGVRAVRVRSALRSRPDLEDRRQYLERVLTAELEGARITDFAVRYEDEPDQPLEFTLEFERPQFARAQDGRLVIDRPLFQEAMQRLYATLSERHLPMFVGYDRDQSYSLELRFPEGLTPQLRARNSELNGAFGHFERKSWVEENTLRVETAIRLPRQRVQPEDYGEFRAWATAVEESAALWLRLE